MFAPAGLIVLAYGDHDGDQRPHRFRHDLGGSSGWSVTLLTFTYGHRPSSRRCAKRVANLLETKGAAAAETQAAIKEILLIARIDVGVLLIVVFDMVMKPFS